MSRDSFPQVYFLTLMTSKSSFRWLFPELYMTKHALACGTHRTAGWECSHSLVCERLRLLASCGFEMSCLPALTHRKELVTGNSSETAHRFLHSSIIFFNTVPLATQKDPEYPCLLYFDSIKSVHRELLPNLKWLSKFLIPGDSFKIIWVLERVTNQRNISMACVLRCLKFLYTLSQMYKLDKLHDLQTSH